MHYLLLSRRSETPLTRSAEPARFKVVVVASISAWGLGGIGKYSQVHSSFHQAYSGSERH
jgi:hypothetical protein